MAQQTRFEMNTETPVDRALQAAVEDIVRRGREKFQLEPEHAAVGVLDLLTGRLALVRPDAIDYAASVPKIGILLAWFALRPDPAAPIEAETRHALGLMIKQSDNAAATRFSRELGLGPIQEVLTRRGFYDPQKGGIWMGKHYGANSERLLDPLSNNSHAATVRALVRFFLKLQQGELVSPAASRMMREIFASPDIPHIEDRFVKALAGREATLLRKSGWWETWSHDAAIVQAPGRHYIVVALTHHANGTAFLEEFARGVDDLLTPR